jgi:hypothetical protein
MTAIPHDYWKVHGPSKADPARVRLARFFLSRAQPFQTTSTKRCVRLCSYIPITSEEPPCLNAK